MSKPNAAMLSTTVLGDDNCHASLSTMPPEVATNIFCQLPSFSDVFALSAVCLRLRHLWLENVNSIYNQIAPRSIPCESAARRFLVDDDGPGLEFPMSAKDVIRVVQNAGVIENTVLQFEREVVRWVKMDAYGLVETEKFYGPGVRKHPPTLTRTERIRFIRSYYSVSTLMRVDRSEWDSRLQGMTSQELYYLKEMADLTEGYGMLEEIVPPPTLPLQPPDSLHSINHSEPRKRFDLGQRIWQQIQRNSLRFFEQDAFYTSCYAKHEGFFVFVVFWDHWQPSLKDIVCHESSSAIKPSPAVRKQYLWNDELDE